MTGLSPRFALAALGAVLAIAACTPTPGGPTNTSASYGPNVNGAVPNGPAVFTTLNLQVNGNPIVIENKGTVAVSGQTIKWTFGPMGPTATPGAYSFEYSISFKRPFSVGLLTTGDIASATLQINKATPGGGSEVNVLQLTNTNTDGTSKLEVVNGLATFTLNSTIPKTTAPADIKLEGALTAKVQ